MAATVYILGSLTSLICAILLLRAYSARRRKLLLWSGLCFGGLSLSNLLVFVDLVLLPNVDLYLYASCGDRNFHDPAFDRNGLGEPMMRLVPFLLGIIAMASLTAGVFFLKFWRVTRDVLFLAFGVFFWIEAGSRVALLFFEHPSEGSPWIYLLRLFALLLILAAILKKNYSRTG